MTHEHFQEGTVIAGTLRSEDLISAFYYELQQIAPAAAQMRREGTWKEEIEHALAGGDFYDWESQEWPSWACEALQDDLSSNAPSGMYFGTLEGDASDWGFWFVPDYDNFECEE